MASRTVETTRALVTSVGPEGATVAFNGHNTPVSWDTLHAAARQEDPGLRRVYSEILAQAEDRAADGPVTIEVDHDDTNVRWVCRVRAAWGGGFARFRRDADEGGSYEAYSTAAFEARAIASRLGKRVVSLRA
jgi:hypothetical protein